MKAKVRAPFSKNGNINIQGGMTPEPPESGVIPSLDGLRAISISIVLASHAGYGSVVPGGLGVTIFFFLSGYLITTLLVDERERTGRIDIGKFYLRRAFRLFPSLLVTLVIAYSLVILGLLYGGISWAGVLAQLLYFANYYGLYFDPGNTTAAGTGILWSLAVEEHFYMIYPAALVGLLALRLSRQRIVVVLAIVCLAVLAWRMYLVDQPNFETERTYYSSDTRMDSIVFGCLLALAANPRSAKAGTSNPFLEPRSATLLSVAAIVMAMTIAWRDVCFRETFRYSLQGLALMPVFYFAIKCAAHFPFTLLNHPWVARIGVYSYAMYLIHYIVINVIEKNAPGLAAVKPLLVLMAFLIAIVYAAILDVFVDSYFRRLRKLFR
jgi:peptidoglycan/LPS O-acetylase OafA/YrhL